MTYPAQAAQNVFQCNGVQTVFAYTFGIPLQPDNANADAVVATLITPGAPTVITALVNNTDYSLDTIGNTTGGNLTSKGAHSPFPNGSILVVQRAMDLAQETTFPNQGFLPSDIEASFDQLMQTLQQVGLVPDLTKVMTVATLPAANTVPFTRRWVTDATTTTFGAVVVGGGTNAVPVFSDSANWRIG